MSVFVDTSALYALLNRADEAHGVARRAFAFDEHFAEHGFELVAP